MTARPAPTPRPSFADWDSARARFSHDWLRNRLAIALGKYRNVLAGAVLDDSAEAQLRAMADEWPERHVEATRLLDLALDVLSPRRGFERPELAILDPETVLAAADRAEREWRLNAAPHAAVRQARDALARLDAALAAARIEGPRLEPGWVDEARAATREAAEAMTVLGRCRPG